MSPFVDATDVDATHLEHGDLIRVVWNKENVLGFAQVELNSGKKIPESAL